MKQFLDLTNLAAFDDLERRARAACIVFTNQEMPPACVPNHARIGVEVHPTTGRATLFVDHGVQYFGFNDSLKKWLDEGAISFASFAQLKTWLHSDLKAEFARNLDAVPAPTTQNITVQMDAAQLNAKPVWPKSFSGAFLVSAIRYLGTRYGLDVRFADEATLRKVDHGFMNHNGRTCSAILEDILAPAFALASVRGHTAVTVSGGPPIACKSCS
jgi:hypothetical protein